jgi:DNA-binding transcriptional LysR family regulator
MDWVDRIGRRIRLRDLHVLLAVAESGSMSKASAQLAVSHPVVSKTILQLEQSLGVRLFERSTRGVELTPYGSVLLNCGIAVFDEMRQGLKQLEAIADPAAGELRIGCPEITMAGLLPAIVERFSKQYPRVAWLAADHCRQGAEPNRSTRKSRKTLTLGRRWRPGT